MCICWCVNQHVRYITQVNRVELHVSSHKCVTGHLYKDKYMYIILCIHQNTFTIHIHICIYPNAHTYIDIIHTHTPIHTCTPAHTYINYL